MSATDTARRTDDGHSDRSPVARETCAAQQRQGGFRRQFLSGLLRHDGRSLHPSCGEPFRRRLRLDWFMGDDVRHNGVLMLTDSYRF